MSDEISLQQALEVVERHRIAQKATATKRTHGWFLVTTSEGGGGYDGTNSHKMHFYEGRDAVPDTHYTPPLRIKAHTYEPSDLKPWVQDGKLP